MKSIVSHPFVISIKNDKIICTITNKQLSKVKELVVMFLLY